MTSPTTRLAPQRVSDRRLALISLVLGLGMFITLLDTTIVNVALDHLRTTFDATVAQTQWIATGYLLAFVSVIPVSGWLSERFVVDRHSAHRSRKVRALPADHSDRIELHFLPSYPPKLNPDELVNVDLKRSFFRCTAGPATMPGSPPGPVGSSTDDDASHTSAAATSAAHMTAAPSNGTL